MTAARTLLLAPAAWLALMYAVHPRDPGKAVLGWALVFAPFYLAVCVAEALARIQERWKYRNDGRRGVGLPTPGSGSPGAVSAASHLRVPS
jgi:hypothetical protein